MTKSDETILDLLSEKDVALKPGGIKANLDIENIDISKRTIYRRLEVLDAAGMVREPENWAGRWMTTELAEKWLNEEIEADDVSERLEDTDY